MMNKKLSVSFLQLVAVGLVATCGSNAPAAVYINEIFFNPPSLSDLTNEFVELRGNPSMSLNGYYLILVDSMTSGPPFYSGNAGSIEHIFNLNGRSLGTNGYLTYRQKGNPYAAPPAGTTNLVNAGSGPGFGNGASSSIGVSDQNTSGVGNGQIESGFTAMLINIGTGAVPTLGFDLDLNNNGLDNPNGRTGWTILDSIGFAEPGEAPNARFYAKINYGTEAADTFDPASRMEPGCTTCQYIGLGFEAEYAARWGNSTGQTAADWQVADVTDDPGSGYQNFGTDGAGQPNAADFRVSRTGTHPLDNGDTTPPPQPTLPDIATSSQGVPYGTILTNTLGAPNFLLGDYNKDGVVNAADYVVWRKTFGQTGSDTNQLAADGDHDYAVGNSDDAVWKAHFGQPASAGTAGSGSVVDGAPVPEPAGWFLVVIGSFSALPLRKHR